MRKTVSATEARCRLSRLLHGASEGQHYVVTRHNKPVAQIVPVGERDEVAVRARITLLARLCSQPIVEAGRWTREELYGDTK